MKRERIVLLDIHAVAQSQPATDGGWKSSWPIESHSHVHASRSIPLPVVRSAPATNTTGLFTMSGASRSAYSALSPRISRTTGLMSSPEDVYVRASRLTADFDGGRVTKNPHSLVTRKGAW